MRIFLLCTQFFRNISELKRDSQIFEDTFFEDKQLCNKKAVQKSRYFCKVQRYSQKGEFSLRDFSKFYPFGLLDDIRWFYEFVFFGGLCGVVRVVMGMLGWFTEPRVWGWWKIGITSSSATATASTARFVAQVWCWSWYHSTGSAWN